MQWGLREASYLPRMKPPAESDSTWLRRVSVWSQTVIAACLTVAVWATLGHALILQCDGATDEQIVTALARIEQSVDPCGESAEVREILETFNGCPSITYRICTNAQANRNLFDRPTNEPTDAPMTRIITWNPILRSELEPGCNGDATKAVLRDPTASLLHELVHAAHDCLGMNPGEHEIEAVRIENIYRRAAGLCQRTTYGEDVLPAAMRKQCAPGYCSCSTPRSGELVQTQLKRPDSRASPERMLGDDAAPAHTTHQD
jgi:hypothetical protein